MEKAPGRPKQPRALRRAALPDPFTYALYACSPYRGCGHGCSYCDGRAEKYYVEGDFARDIVTRDWLPDALARELAALREWGALALGSGVTDVYQPCERTALLTKRVAEAVAEMPDRSGAGGVAPLPVALLTKSALVLRDLDLWQRVNARAAVLVLVSLTTLDDHIRETFEPNASSVGERLEILRTCNAVGIATGVLAMPFLPGITDDAGSIEALYDTLSELGVSFVMPGCLTLRPGRQRAHYEAVLAASHPELAELYASLYRENRSSGSPVWAYHRTLEQRVAPIRRRLAMPKLLPHQLLRHLLAPHDELCVVFAQMAELYRERGVDTRRLERAAERYGTWLKGLRTELRRRRSLPACWLDERFRAAIASGELAQVLANDKLAPFAARIAGERALLDHQTLALYAP
jgi:DNA repair photolyase